MSVASRSRSAPSTVNARPRPANQTPFFPTPRTSLESSKRSAQRAAGERSRLPTLNSCHRPGDGKLRCFLPGGREAWPRTERFMARAAVGRRRTRRQAVAGFPRRVVEECVGVALLGIALLAVLGLASFDPADPVFSRAAVANRAGMVGATTAILLLRAFGAGAWVCVASLGLLGGRLVLGRGIPSPLSRFWAASALLLAATATLPVLLAGPGGTIFADLPRGILGGGLADVEAMLVGRWGGLVANAALAAIGVLMATGVSMGPLLEGFGAAAGAFGAAIAWGTRGVGHFAVGLGQGAQRAAVR
ncbi:MAG: hypothetical protein E4H11_03280, partial [Myxococcales bacterium]